MKVFEAAGIRNVAVVGHSGAGKTQLISALLFDAGAVNRFGKVDDGTTTTDYDEEAIARLCANYIDNIRAYVMREKVKNRYTGRDEEPDERLMRSVEEKIDIPESRKDDFRREIMNYIGHLALEGKKFEYNTNDRLRRALEMKLFEDQKDSIKLSSFVSNVIDKETQDKIDIIKGRLIKNYGYNEASATDVLAFVASIFARGDVKD